jgi:hypothetical protein
MTAKWYLFSLECDHEESTKDVLACYQQTNFPPLLCFTSLETFGNEKHFLMLKTFR